MERGLWIEGSLGVKVVSGEVEVGGWVKKEVVEVEEEEGVG
jgi:hypothetical protein